MLSNYAHEKTRFTPRSAVGIALLVTLAVQQPLTAAVIVVEGECTLADAIHAANGDVATGGCPAGAGADEIQLTADVRLFEVDNETEGRNGLPPIASEIELNGNGFSIGRDPAAPPFRPLYVTSGPVRLAHLTIRRGLTTDGSSDGNGAGLRVGDGAEVTISDVRVTGNRAPSGGAIFNAGALTVIDSEVTDNASGGISSISRDRLVVVDSRVVRNRGTGISTILDGTLTLTRSTVSGNEDASTGGLWVGGPTLITDSTVSGNRATEPSGGTGGIYFGSRYYEHLVTNTTVSGNVGDGVSIGTFATARLVNTTIAGNTGHGVVTAQDDYYPATVVMQNVVLADQGGSNCRVGGILDYIDLGGNLSDQAFPDCPGAGELTGLDLALRDNGGPTRTHALSLESSAISAAADCGSGADQRGVLRDDGFCDSGAFELAASTSRMSARGSGTCPDRLTLHVHEATPFTNVALYWSTSLGQDIAPGGACAGTEIRLEDPEFIRRAQASFDGSGRLTVALPPNACDGWFGAIDLTTCRVAVSPIPD